jgi:hypothetical protein
MKWNLSTISLATLTALLVLWAALVSFDFAQEYFVTKQDPSYETMSFEFKLKAEPEDVIYSEAYTTKDGGEEVKYAYLAGQASSTPDENIARRTPNSQTAVLAERAEADGEKVETLKTTFYSTPQFYEKDGQWRQVEYATTTPEILSMSGAIPYIKKRELVERLLPGQRLYAASATYYPNPNVETVSVDGYGAMDLIAADTWDYTANDSGTTINVYNTWGVINPGPAYGTTNMYWGLMLFDTSGLPDAAVIDSVTMSLYILTRSGSITCYVVSSNPTSNTAIDNDDYLTLGGTTFASQTCSTFTNTTYNALSLNSSGISNVSKTGISKFGMTADIQSTGSEGITFSSADTTGTSQDPKLDVVYDSRNFSFGQWFPF